MGITPNRGAVLALMVLTADRSEYLRLYREMYGQSNAATDHRPKMLGKDVLQKMKRLCHVLRHASQTGSTHFKQMINSVIWKKCDK